MTTANTAHTCDLADEVAPAYPCPGCANLAERRILEDLIDHHIDPRAILKRRHRTHIDGLVRRGLVTHTERGIELVDEAAALVALGRACGQHDRPLPCLECSA